MYVHVFVTPSFIALIYPSKPKDFGFQELFPGDTDVFRIFQSDSFPFSELLPSETYVVESNVEAGLLDVMMLHRQMEIREEETNRIEVGCEMRLPSPMDVSVAKKLQIELHHPEEEYPEEFVAGSGDFFEDSDLFSGDSELNGKSQKNETFFGNIHFLLSQEQITTTIGSISTMTRQNTLVRSPPSTPVIQPLVMMKQQKVSFLFNLPRMSGKYLELLSAFSDIDESKGSTATSVRQAFKTLVISYLLQRLLQF